MDKTNQTHRIEICVHMAIKFALVLELFNRQLTTRMPGRLTFISQCIATLPPPGCTTTDASIHGANTIYREKKSGGQALASHLLDTVGPSSPDTRDYTCHDIDDPSGCTTINLGELRDTNADAGYLESEFHSWNNGVDWLTQLYWQWRIGQAVARHLGYPGD